MMQRADAAFEDGSISLAVELYESAYSTSTRSLFRGPSDESKFHLYDDVLRHNVISTMTTMVTNLMASNLLLDQQVMASGQEEEEVDEAALYKNCLRSVTWLRDLNLRYLNSGLKLHTETYFYAVLAAVGCHDDGELEYFMHELRMCQTLKEYHLECIDLVENQTVKENPSLVLKRLACHLPLGPVKPELREWKVMSTNSIELERYLLRGFGYAGPLYEDNIVSVNADLGAVESFDAEAADKVIAVRLAEVERDRQQWAKLAICVNMVDPAGTEALDADVVVSAYGRR